MRFDICFRIIQISLKKYVMVFPQFYNKLKSSACLWNFEVVILLSSIFDMIFTHLFFQINPILNKCIYLGKNSIMKSDYFISHES